MFRLLMIVGQLWGEPWEGKNARFLQGLPTGPPHILWTGGDFLPVPGPRGTQLVGRATHAVVDTPQRACRRHDQPARMGADDAVPRAALVLPQPSQGVTVTDRHGHGPAVPIRAPALCRASGESGGAKGCEGGGRLALSWPF